MSEQKRIASRVTQLESHLLDRELGETFDGLVDQLELPAYAEEFKTIVRLYLFANYVGTNASAGMKLYHMNYCDRRFIGQEGIVTDGADNTTRQKLLVLTTLNLVGSYIAKRYQKLEKFLQNHISRSLNLPWLTLDNTILVYKSMNVLNFLAFLKSGTYLTLPERVLGIAPVVGDEDSFNNAQLNRVQIDYMYRETIWRAMAEFLTTIIPLINFQQLKNRMLKLIWLMPKLETQVKLSDKIQQESNAMRCAICLKQPFNPHIIGCRHVFCYYCLQSKYLSDPSMGYVCMQCNYTTDNPTSMQRFKILR